MRSEEPTGSIGLVSARRATQGVGRGYQTKINAVLRSYMDHAKT